MIKLPFPGQLSTAFRHQPLIRLFVVLVSVLALSACEIEGDDLDDGNTSAGQEPPSGGDGGAAGGDGGGAGGDGAGGDGGAGDGDGGAGDGGGGDGGSGGDPMPPPVDPDPPMDPPPPTDQALFQQTLYPKLVDQANFCVGCHGAAQIPTFAVSNAEAAYTALVAQQKVDLNNPELSRVYLRAAVDRHNCGGDANCDRVAMEFLTAISDWQVQAMENTPPPSGDDGPVMSSAVTFADGMDASVARADANLIARFEFMEGAGTTAADTSGVGGAITLELEGTEWVEGGGIRNVSGKAQASLDDSRKLFDMITPENAYSLEAWVIPDDTAQDGPARIVSYSSNTQTRNFTMGQQAIYYAFRNRSDGTGANGTPDLEGLDSEVVTALQHVVMTFDAATGRNVYVNGALVGADAAADNLAWTDDQILVLGNEVTNDRLWKGVIKFAAIHNQSLSAADVQQNFDAGSDSFVTLRFDVAEAVGAPSYIEMQAAQLDPHSYVFAKPTLVTEAASVPVKNLRIAVNGSTPIAAQAFRRIDTTVLGSQAELSPLGAVIPVVMGPETDSFHLEFELLGAMQGQAEAISPPLPPQPTPDVVEPLEGMRTFSQINDTMSVLTGVPQGRNTVRDSFEELRDSLPPAADLNAFGSAQQIAVQRLAKSYCGAAVANNGDCNALFGSCAIAAGDKSVVANRLYDRFVGQGLANQPAAAAVSTELVTLIDALNCADGCDGAQGRTVLQATCTALLGSAAVTIN